MQESKGVEDFGDVIREGGGALAKGLFRGVTGILTKPLEGAKASFFTSYTEFILCRSRPANMQENGL